MVGARQPVAPRAAPVGWAAAAHHASRAHAARPEVLLGASRLCARPALHGDDRGPDHAAPRRGCGRDRDPQPPAGAARGPTTLVHAWASWSSTGRPRTCSARRGSSARGTTCPGHSGGMGRQSGSSQSRWRSPLVSRRRTAARARGGRCARAGEGSWWQAGRDVKVLSTEVVQDENGGRGGVDPHATQAKPPWRSPGVHRRARVGRGQVPVPQRRPRPRAEPGAPCRPGQEFEWVNDQIAAKSSPVPKAKVGEEKSVRSPTSRRSALTRRGWNKTLSAGWQRSGSPRTAQVEQRKLVIFAVARKGGRVAAPAGR